MKKEVYLKEIENVDLRSENAKHFKDEFGKTRAILYSEPVHYQGTDKKYHEIDSELVLAESGKEYVNKHNRFKTRFAKDLSDKRIVEISEDDYKVEIDIHQDGAADNQGFSGFSFSRKHGRNINRNAQARVQNKDKTERRSDETCNVLRNMASKITFDNFSDSTDLEYQVLPNKLKENIIVRERSDNYNFAFEIKLSKLDIKLADDSRSISLLSKTTKEPVFTIPAPIMFDSNNESSEDFSVEIDDLGNDVYLYRVIPNVAWMNSESRVFPITIDPQVISNHSEFITVTNASPATRISKINIKNSIISKAFDKNTKIRSAVLELTKSYMGTDPNQKGYEVYIGNKLIDFFIKPGNKDKIQINITRQLEDSIKNEINRDNEYITVEVRPATGNSGYMQFHNGNVEDFSSPLIMVDYVSEWKALDEKSYLNFDIKKAGTANVNLVNGNLTFTHNDIVPDGSIIPIKVSHTYSNMAEGESFAFSYRNGSKSRLSSGFADYENGLKGFSDGIKKYAMGNGWKLNVQQQLIKHKDADNVLPNDRLTTYIDGDGNRHSFVEKYYYYEDDGKLKDSDGNPIGRKIYVKNEDCYLTDAGDLMYRINHGYSQVVKISLITTYENGEIVLFSGEYEGVKFSFLPSECRIIEYATNSNVQAAYEVSDKKYQIEKKAYGYYYLLGSEKKEQDYLIHYEISDDDGMLILDTIKSKVCYLSENNYNYQDEHYIIKDGKRFDFKREYDDYYKLVMYFNNENSIRYDYYTYAETEYDFDLDCRIVRKDLVNNAIKTVVAQEFTIYGDEVYYKVFYHESLGKIDENMYKTNNSIININHTRNYSDPESPQDILLKIEKTLNNEHIQHLEEYKANLESQKREMEYNFEEYSKQYFEYTDDLKQAIKLKQEELLQRSLELEKYKYTNQAKQMIDQKKMLEIENYYLDRQYRRIYNGSIDTSVISTAQEQHEISKTSNKISLNQLNFESNLANKSQHLLTLQTVMHNMEKAYYEQEEEKSKDLINSTLITLREQMELIDKELETVETFLIKYRNEEKLKPMDYIYTSNGETLGFDYYGRLVSYTGVNKQTCSIVYEEDKLVKIIDSDNNSILFEYHDSVVDDEYFPNKLKSITDFRGRITKFDYNDQRELSLITYPDNSHSKYLYSGNKLYEIEDTSGYGIKFNYSGNRVSKVTEFTATNKISSGGLEKSGSRIEGEFTEIEYFNSESAIIRNKRNVKTAFVFDRHGNTVSTYDYDAFTKGIVPAAAKLNVSNMYEKDTDSSVKYTFSCESNRNSPNIIESTQLGSAKINLNTYPNQLSTYVGLVNIGGNRYGEHKIVQNITPDEMGQLRDYYVFSGWGKSETAVYTAGRGSEFLAQNALNKDIPELDDLQLYRRFGLCVKARYDSDAGNPGHLIDVFYSPFDWQNKNWQYNAVVLKVRRDPVTNVLIAPMSVDVSVEYSCNEGTAHFANLCFNQCEFKYGMVDEDNNSITIRERMGETKLEFNDDKKLVRMIQKNIYSDEYVTDYFYNEKGLPTLTEDYKGFITESFYDENDELIRSVTYHKDEPASKFYSDFRNDDKGRLSEDYGAISELGSDESMKLEYHPDTALLKSLCDHNGNKTMFGYNHLTDKLTHISNGIDENVLSYNHGYMTNLRHNDTNFGYTYDGFGRIKQVSIEGVNYYQEVTYNDNSDVVVLSNGTGSERLYDKYGRVTAIKHINNGVASTYLENTYDESTGNLTHQIEYLESGTVEHEYIYDEFGCLKSKTTIDSDQNVIIDYAIYNVLGQITFYQAGISNETIMYAHRYSDTLNPKVIETDVSDNGEPILIEKLSYDKQDRISRHALEKQGSDIIEDIEYLKINDHATNLITSLRHSVGNKTKSRFTYKYDKNGNIIKVSENGSLINSYEYDSHNRLIREDNSHFGTFIFEYDKGGNILSKRIYNYSLEKQEILDSANTLLSVNEYEYKKSGWKDQMFLFNGETITYDEIGNPLRYIGKNLTWTHGRRLASIDNTSSYSYNTSGIRISKTVNGVKTDYCLSGNRVLSEKTNGNTIKYMYGNRGLIGFKYNNHYYYYLKNIQGDIVSILDEAGNIIVRYNYDAWGNHDIEDNSGINLGNISPFRYRSYYYDKETGLFYCSQRYYDPEIGRWISPDDISYLDPESINGLNLYCYCGNNPVMLIDSTGRSAVPWWQWVVGGLILVGSAALAVVTLGASIGVTAALAVTLGTIASAGVIGGIYGGITASEAGGNFWDGFGIGALNSSVMATLSLINPAVAIGSGFVVGTFGDVWMQTAINPGQAINWEKAIYSGIQSGIVNMFANGLSDIAKPFANTFLNHFMVGIAVGHFTSGISTIIDLFRDSFEKGRDIKKRRTLIGMGW